MIKELMLLMVVLIVFMSVCYQRLSNRNFDEYKFIHRYLYTQSKAFNLRQKIAFQHQISFNALGNINQAKTINIDNKQIILRIGNGSIKKK